MPTPQAEGERFDEPSPIVLLEGDLDSGSVPGWWLSEPIPERRFLPIALPYVSPRAALRLLAGFLGAFALGAVISTVVASLLDAFLPGAGTVIVSLPVGELRLANELTFIILAAAVTIRIVRIGTARTPLVYFLGLLLEINVIVVLDRLLLG